MSSVLQSVHPVELRDLSLRVPVEMGKVVRADYSAEWEIHQFLCSQDLDHYFGMYQVWKCLLHTSRKQIPNIWWGQGGGTGNFSFCMYHQELASKTSVRRKDGWRSFLFTRMM